MELCPPFGGGVTCRSRLARRKSHVPSWGMHVKDPGPEITVGRNASIGDLVKLGIPKGASTPNWLAATWQSLLAAKQKYIHTYTNLLYVSQDKSTRTFHKCSMLSREDQMCQPLCQLS